MGTCHDDKQFFLAEFVKMQEIIMLEVALQPEQKNNVVNALGGYAHKVMMEELDRAEDGDTQLALLVLNMYTAFKLGQALAGRTFNAPCMCEPSDA